MQVKVSACGRTGEDAEGGGLAGAIDTQQTEAFALPDGHADAGDRPYRQLPVGCRVRLRDVVKQHLTTVWVHATCIGIKIQGQYQETAAFARSIYSDGSFPNPSR